MARTTPSGPSQTQDTAGHHSSPLGKVQTPAPIKPPAKSVAREVTGKIYNPKLPDHVTKHSNPVGRPKDPRG